VHFMSKILKFAYCGESYRIIFRPKSVFDVFILLTVQGMVKLSFICFRLHPYSTAAKIVVCCSLTFVLVETSSNFMIFVKLGIAVIVNLILFLASSFV